MLNGITGVANFMFLPNDPSEVGLDPVEKKAPGAPAGGGGSIGFMQARIHAAPPLATTTHTHTPRTLTTRHLHPPSPSSTPTSHPHL